MVLAEAGRRVMISACLIVLELLQLDVENCRHFIDRAVSRD